MYINKKNYLNYEEYIYYCLFRRRSKRNRTLIMSKGYEGVQNDSYRYCREKIWWTFKQAKKHHIDFIYVGVNSYQLVISRTKRGLRRKGFKYIEKKRMFYKLLSRCNNL